ncbi:acetolactate synthase large subunit [Mycobacterium sp. NPDC048908]|uniref:acetolactate synthase large subunit n=1 Tax=Mycobacterium sp. NPDC048908 TaxID=3364292 RepID=UPI0037230767
MTTGAEIVVERLTAGGVEVCFANPGTSEMHFVAALDSAPGMRAVLCLFEGVATGAADGYARMAGKPAATLLHLGPGMANGLANLHNARRAHSPVVNIVGDHATDHQKLDAPLQSDIDALGHWLTSTVHRPASSAELAAAVDAAIAAAALGRIATLILPADLSWSEADLKAATRSAQPIGDSQATDVDASAIAELLTTSGGQAVLLLGGAATGASELRAAAAIAAATGARLLIETFPARLTRGRGVPNIPRLGYFAELARQQLDGTTHLILVGARSPVAFFAYPNITGDLVPTGATVHELPAGRLGDVAERLGAREVCDPAPNPPELPSGPLRSDNWAAVVGALLPENAIISDEANTSGLLLPDATAAAPLHDVLTLTGGAIGQGLPVAVGAAIAAPHRPVIALQSDGSALYTISALWTMAREQLDITVVILDNRAYAILQIELMRVGASAGGPKARSLLDLSKPDLDFVAIAEGFGVSAKRATTAEELAEHFRTALAEPGPHLIDAVLTI